MKIKQSLTVFLLCLIMLNLVTATIYPTLKPHINDFTDSLTNEEISKLDQLCLHIKEETTIEVAIILIKSFNGIELKTYATEIKKQNNVGSKNIDNSIIVIWSTEDKKGYIDIGKEIENTLTDLEVTSIIRGAFPLFNNDKYYEGFKYTLNEIQLQIGAGGEGDASFSTTDSTITFSTKILIVFLSFLFLIGLLFMIFDEIAIKKSKRNKR